MPVTEGSPSPPGDTSPWPRNNRCREYKNRNIGAENRAKNWIKLLMLGSLDSGFYGNIKLDQAFLRRREETESTVTVSSPHKDNVRPRTLWTQSIDLTSSLVIYF